MRWRFKDLQIRELLDTQEMMSTAGHGQGGQGSQKNHGV